MLEVLHSYHWLNYLINNLDRLRPGTEMGEIRQKNDGNQMERLFTHVYYKELLIFFE